MSLNEKPECKLPVHKILPFANVDGLGNRTSIFVQGCNIRCIYCHNPETQEQTGNDHVYNIVQLLDQIQPNLPYIRGITVSGGEPTLYHTFLTSFFLRVHELKKTCYIDTNGYFNSTDIKDLITVTDKFLFDVKTIQKSQELVGKNITGNLENLVYLLQQNKIEEVRTVVTEEIGDAQTTIDEVSKILKYYPDVLYKIIKVHTRGSRNPDMLEKYVPSNKKMNELGTRAQSNGVRKIWIQL